MLTCSESNFQIVTWSSGRKATVTRSNKALEFPDILCKKIAEITDRFSFAYMQEAFVATLLVLAKDGEQRENSDDEWLFVSTAVGDDDDDGDDELDRFALWREMKKQLKILRHNMR